MPPLAVVAVGLGAALRMLALGKSLYIDEIVTITVATQPLARMGDVMRQIDASPALYPLLLHGWLLVVHADWWARLLSATFGIAAVWVAFLLARRAFGDVAGVAAAFVAALAPAHVHYAQYVRSYSLFTLLAGVQLLLFFDLMRLGHLPLTARLKPGTTNVRAGQLTARLEPGTTNVRVVPAARVIAFVAVTAALFYTHYLSLLAIVPEAMYAAYAGRRHPRAALEWGVATIVAGALFLPGVPLLRHNLQVDRIRNDERPRPPPAVRLLPNLMGELTVGQRALGFSNPWLRRATLAAGAVVFPALLMTGVRAGWRTHRDGTLLLLLFAFVPVAVYVLSGRRLVAVRFFLPFMLGYVALVGNGLAALGARARAVAAVAVAVIGVVPLAHFYTRFDWSYDHARVARAVDERWHPGDAMGFVHPYEALFYRWYLGPTVPMKGLVFTALEDQPGYVIKPPAIRFDSARPRVEAMGRQYDRVWIVGQSARSFASNAAEEQRLFAWMDARYGRLDDLSALTGGDPVVRLYAGAPARQADTSAVGRKEPSHPR